MQAAIFVCALTLAGSCHEGPARRVLDVDLVDINTVWHGPDSSTTFVTLWEYYPNGEFHSRGWFNATEPYYLNRHTRHLTYGVWLIVFDSVMASDTPDDLEMRDRQATGGRYSLGCLKRDGSLPQRSGAWLQPH